jgi:hypothetical protein
MVFQRLPEHHQQIALRRFDAFVNVIAIKSLGLGDDLLDAMPDGGVEQVCLPGWMRISGISRIMRSPCG